MEYQIIGRWVVFVPVTQRPIVLYRRLSDFWIVHFTFGKEKCFDLNSDVLSPWLVGLKLFYLLLKLVSRVGTFYNFQISSCKITSKHFSSFLWGPWVPIMLAAFPLWTVIYIPLMMWLVAFLLPFFCYFSSSLMESFNMMYEYQNIQEITII